jgi:hypothetical protein
MKAKIIAILLINILLSVQLFAARTSFKERTENWLKQSESVAERPGITEPGSPDTPGAPRNLPVGDALLPLLLLSLVYGISRVTHSRGDFNSPLE